MAFESLNVYKASLKIFVRKENLKRMSRGNQKIRLALLRGRRCLPVVGTASNRSWSRLGRQGYETNPCPTNREDC